jgi:phage nucleotide-binding protein
VPRPRRQLEGQPPEADMVKIKARVERRVHRADQLPLNLAVIVYARPKVGKTRFCASAPNVLIIDCDEKGTDSTRDDLNPRVIRITRWSEINDIYWYLQSGDHDFESVAIDTVSGLQTLAMNFVLGEDVARDASRDPDQPSQRVYQKVTQLMKTQITNFRNLPLNVIFTAHTRTKEQGEGEDEIITITGPNLSPASAAHLLGAVGLIGYLSKREVVVKRKVMVDGEEKLRKRRVSKTRMLIGPSERFETGVRYSALKDLDYIDSPNFASLLEAIKQGKGKEVEGSG